MHKSELTNAQVRAARALLGWTAKQLAAKVGVHRNTISNIEVGRYAPPETMQAIKHVLQQAGVEFTNGRRPGVRLKRI